MKRKHVLTLRSMMHGAEQTIQKSDRSRVAERERDLLATAACALWDLELKKFHSCLKRLTTSPSESQQTWILLYSSAAYILTGAWRVAV